MSLESLHWGYSNAPQPVVVTWSKVVLVGHRSQGGPDNLLDQIPFTCRSETRELLRFQPIRSHGGSGHKIKIITYRQWSCGYVAHASAVQLRVAPAPLCTSKSGQKGRTGCCGELEWVLWDNWTDETLLPLALDQICFYKNETVILPECILL